MTSYLSPILMATSVVCLTWIIVHCLIASRVKTFWAFMALLFVILGVSFADDIMGKVYSSPAISIIPVGLFAIMTNFMAVFALFGAKESIDGKSIRTAFRFNYSEKDKSAVSEHIILDMSGNDPGRHYKGLRICERNLFQQHFQTHHRIYS